LPAWGQPRRLSQLIQFSFLSEMASLIAGQRLLVLKKHLSVLKEHWLVAKKRLSVLKEYSSGAKKHSLVTEERKSILSERLCVAKERLSVTYLSSHVQAQQGMKSLDDRPQFKQRSPQTPLQEWQLQQAHQVQWPMTADQFHHQRQKADHC